MREELILLPEQEDYREYLEEQLMLALLEIEQQNYTIGGY